ncbi:hypothetical protein AAGY65_00975 [Staphylococcus aureus]
MTEMVFYKIYFVVTPQLALSVEFLFEILYVGARQLVKTLKTIISIKSGIDMTVFTLINNIVF